MVRRTRIHFDKAIERIQDDREATKTQIKNAMKIKTGSGNVNYILGINPADFVDGERIETSVLWRGKKITPK